MESVKETLSNWFENFNEYINSFKVVEKQKNIFYFSKYSLILSDFYQIYVFVKTLKENIFRSLIEQFKYCVKSIIKFENESLSEKEKIINLYSSLLLIYYKKFGYDTNNKFEDYFDAQFLEISKNVFKYDIINNELFKIFVFYYYTFIQKEIKSLGYERIKKLKTYYNYNINNNENNFNYPKKRKISNTNSYYTNRNNTSTTISNTSYSNNDYFPDPNILLPKKKNIKKNSNNNIINNSSNTNSMTIEDSEDDVEMGNDISNKNCQQQQFFDSSRYTEQVLTYLTSTKERMVDLVVEMGFKGLSPLFLMGEYNVVNESFKKFNNISLEDYQNKGISFEINNEKNNDDMDDLPQKTKTLNVNKNSINSINKNNNIINFINPLNNNNNIFDNINNINNNNFINNNKNNNNKNNNIISDKSPEIIRNNSFFSINKFVPSCEWQSIFNNYNDNDKNTQNINDNQSSNSSDGSSNNIFSKRILSELSKFEVDDQIIKIIEIVANKIDENYLDDMLNNSQKKTVTVINSFSCYIVEFPPEMLQNIEPKYKEVLKNYCIKFIVIAKELYNISMELFTTIYDLSYTNLDTFIDLSKNCGIQIQYAQSLYKMFKDYSTILLKEKESFTNIKMILGKLFKQQKKLWDHTIKEKANEFTSFYKI